MIHLLPDELLAQVISKSNNPSIFSTSRNFGRVASEVVQLLAPTLDEIQDANMAAYVCGATPTVETVMALHPAVRGHRGIAKLMISRTGGFDYENFSSDDLLGRITLSIPDPLPSEPAFCVLDREWLRVEPCSTTEQDKLKTFSNVRRSLTKAIRVFHDTEWLHKQDDLGEMCVSLTAFRLDELPSLVRQSKQTRRLSQSVVGEATLKLESELGAARRDSDRSARALEVERAKTARLEDEVARLEERHDAAHRELREAADTHAELDRRELRLRGVAEGAQSETDAWRERVQMLEASISALENERDRERLRARKLERERDDAVQLRGTAPVATDDLSLEDLQERIHGLTLAYYYMKRKQPPVAPAPLLDHVNRYSLPGAPALKAIADGEPS